MLITWWGKKAYAGTGGDGPCVSIMVTAQGGPEPITGAGWCDLPEKRLIGDWASVGLGPTSNVAWGPVTTGSVAQVRIEFIEGEPVVVAPKPTPWVGFDYWFVTYDRKPAALVALDGRGAEVAREDVSRRPPHQSLF
jgi:hypothetical protein